VHVKSKKGIVHPGQHGAAICMTEEIPMGHIASSTNIGEIEEGPEPKTVTITRTKITRNQTKQINNCWHEKRPKTGCNWMTQKRMSKRCNNKCELWQPQQQKRVADPNDICVDQFVDDKNHLNEISCLLQLIDSDHLSVHQIVELLCIGHSVCPFVDRVMKVLAAAASSSKADNC